MASDQHLCFRWKDHMQHISKVLKNLQEDEIHCDISLVTDDGYVVKAHQAVLASTSSYFKEVLKTISTDQHPIIVLNGANYSQVASLLHYMYEGSIKVEHDILDSLLEVADNLGVKGLCHVRENTSIKNLLTTTSHSPNRLQYSSPSNENPTSKDTTQLFNADSNTDDIDLDVTPTNSRVDSGTCRLDLSPVHSTPCRYTTNLPFTDTRDLASCSSNSRSHHQSTFSDVEPDDQISGMDLTLAKSDTWSPRHGSSRKRKKMESPSLEESNLYSTSDPDWGRIDKIDDNSPKKKNSSGKLESDLDTQISMPFEQCTRIRKSLDSTPSTSFAHFDFSSDEDIEIKFDKGSIIKKSQTESNYPISITRVQFGEAYTITPNQHQKKLTRVEPKIKGPKNAFILFCGDVRASVKEDFPEYDRGAIMKEMSRMWNSLEEPKKNEYKQKAHVLREEHRKTYPNFHELRNSYREDNERYLKEKAARQLQYFIKP